MDHVASCVECARFWQDLQQAQALVLSLARQRVGTDFREQLFERIGTGEGTPTAVFQEHVSTASKVRYLLTGAAAAAAVLVAATLVQTSGEVVDPAGVRQTANVATTEQPNAAYDEPHEARLAASTPVSGSPDYRASAAVEPLSPRDSMRDFLGAVKPLTTDLVAIETARQFEQRHKWTSHRLMLLDQRKTDEAMARSICDDARELGELGGVLVDLRNAKVLSFRDAQVDADLRVFMSLLDRDRLGERGDGLETVRRVVGPALRESGSLGRLTASMSVAPSFDRDTQVADLLRISRSWPDVIGQIFFVLPNGPDLNDLDPRELSRTFVLQDSCGPVYVAPMSEMQGPRMVFRRWQSRVELRIRTEDAVSPPVRTDGRHDR